MGIFKSKPGGSFLGNLVRGVANKFSGGILGNGAMLQASLAKQEGDAAKLDAANVQIQQAVSLGRAAVVGVVGDQLGNNTEVKKMIADGIWSKYKFYIIGAGSALVLLITYLIMRKPKFGKRR